MTATFSPVSNGFDHYRYSGYSAPSTAAFDVVLPGLASTTTIYVRRRVVALLVFSVTMALLWLGAGKVLASRGGDPASVPAVRPGATYVVQPGDTLWSISTEHHGTTVLVEYLDQLVEVNGDSTVIHVGQVIQLP